MAEKPVKCPSCKSIQDGLRIEDDNELTVETPRGRLRITGYVCAVCGRVIHWPAKRRVKSLA